MAMMNEPRPVAAIKDDVAALEVTGLTAAEITARWSKPTERCGAVAG
jgi:hypothetical protein